MPDSLAVLLQSVSTSKQSLAIKYVTCWINENWPDFWIHDVSFKGPGKGTEYNHWVNWEWFEIGDIGRNYSQSLFFKAKSLIINSSSSGTSSNVVKCVTLPFLARDAKCLGSSFAESKHKGKSVIGTSSTSIVDL